MNNSLIIVILITVVSIFTACKEEQKKPNLEIKKINIIKTIDNKTKKEVPEVKIQINNSSYEYQAATGSQKTIWDEINKAMPLTMAIMTAFLMIYAVVLSI